MDLLVAMSSWIDRLELAAVRAYKQKNVTAYALLAAAADHTKGSLIAQEILSDVAAIGREIHSERTKEGLARARIYGTKTGRPPGRPKVCSPEQRRTIRELSAKGVSTRRISAELGITRGTVRRELARLKFIGGEG
jgi:DNA invertase Pin-like site-specific DNA recombinase